VANNSVLLEDLQCLFLDNIFCCFEFLILWPTGVAELSEFSMFLLVEIYHKTGSEETNVKCLYLVWTFVDGVHIYVGCAYLYLVCTLVSGAHLCIWCAYLCLVCTFVSGVHICICCVPLYLMYTFVSGVHLCIWCARLYLTCAFVGGHGPNIGQSTVGERVCVCICCARLYVVCALCTIYLVRTFVPRVLLSSQ
jgi:hypothetical protein